MRSYRLAGWGVGLLGLLAGAGSCRPQPAARLRVSVVGDVLLARAVPAALTRDSAALRQATRQHWASSRYVLGNLECPLTDSAWPVTKPVVFQGNPRWAGWLRQVGFTHLSLANNHTLDQHQPGLQATAQVLRAAHLGPLGYQPDSLAGCRPTVLGPDSSVVVFTYAAMRQQLPGENCVCGRDFAALCRRVAAYKTLFPERAVLTYLHWGSEYAAQPSAAQRQQAHDLLDAGAAAVVGTHPHVVQPVEFYRGRPIVYSLGNFVFDQRGGPAALAAQVDFDFQGGQVVATYLRPWLLAGAVPHPAPAAACRALAQRLLPPDGSARLLTQAAAATGWQLYPAASATAPDSLPAYLVPHLVLRGPPPGRTTVRLHYLPALGRYVLAARTGDALTRLPLSSRVYQLTQGDLNNDGQAEVLVGPYRATPLDAVPRRRLFAYQLDSTGHLQPLWRGSRLLFELLYFGTRRESGRTYVLTIEREPGGRYCVGQYQWRGFGLALHHFRARGLGRAAAYQAFTQAAE